MPRYYVNVEKKFWYPLHISLIFTENVVLPKKLNKKTNK